MNEGWGRRAGFPGTGAGTFILRSSAGKQKQQVKARNHNLRTSLAVAVQWLRLCTSNAEDAGWIPAQGTKIPRAAKEETLRKESNMPQMRCPFTLCEDVCGQCHDRVEL